MICVTWSTGVASSAGPEAPPNVPKWFADTTGYVETLSPPIGIEWAGTVPDCSWDVHVEGGATEFRNYPHCAGRHFGAHPFELICYLSFYTATSPPLSRSFQWGYWCMVITPVEGKYDPTHTVCERFEGAHVYPDHDYPEDATADTGWIAASQGSPQLCAELVAIIEGALDGPEPSPPASLQAPEARCDAFWVKPHGELNVPAPGFLANDSDPQGLPIAAHVDRINFGVSSHPYHYLGRTGALRFRPGATPGEKPFAAEITYHVTNSRGASSPPTTITIYVQRKRPAAANLTGCGKPPAADRGAERSSNYSLAGICGRKSSSSSTPRCYLLIGAGTIRALKAHEIQLLKTFRIAIGDAIGNAAKRAAVRKAKSQVITYAIRKVAGHVAAAGFSGFEFGKLLGRITSAAITARRWADLESPGYPHKCFLSQLTYEDSAPRIALDPIYSFVRSWDFENPPSYRGISTSMARWESPHDIGATLPLFCKGDGAEAVMLGSSSGTSDLLDPPYVKFSIDFDR